jgi:Tfp pilus assembly protein PilN
MKNLNFIHSLPLRSQRSINRWFVRSVTACAVVCVFMCGVQAWQVYRLVNVRSERMQLRQHSDQYGAATQRKQKLATQLDSVQKRRTAIASQQKQLDSVLALLEMVQADIAGGFKVQTCKLAGSKVALQVECKTADEAIQLVKNIKNKPIMHKVTLNSLKSTPGSAQLQGRVVCAIEGVLGVSEA